jgi:tetratricopeptide (TPR) repeat protein
MLTAATALYNRHKQFTNSLTVVDRMLAINAGNVSALLNKGYICNQLGKYDEAISSLNKLLTVETNNPYGLLYRGMAYLQSDQLSQAKADYEALLRTYPTAFQPYYDLAEIAMRQGDTNVAIRYAETFLNSSQTNTAEYQVMTERLRSLKGEKPK